MIGISNVDEKIVAEHFNAIKEYFSRKRLTYTFKTMNEWIKNITNNEFDFEKVIKGRPNELEKVIQKVNTVDRNKIESYIDENGKEKYRFIYKENQYMLNVYKDFANAGNEHFKKINYGALKLVKNLRLDVCPYCNRNFINNTQVSGKDKEKHIRRTCQLDHFYPKSEYPYLALSFYNLIPVCSVCNKIKLDNEMKVNPYNIKNSDEHITFDYKFDTSINKIIPDTSYMSSDFKSNWDVLGLEELYKVHTNYLNDLLIRIEIYNKLYIDDVKTLINNLNVNKEKNSIDLYEKDVERIFLGNYLNEEELNKQPLAKLTKDIYKQYK
ncbi:HNH nuclease [Clostridium neonatale]|uniref:HNH endonuclease n=1 Tax=Clostridium neonatale TaxID=137838 RepID=UPI00291C37A9|nr:HNH endonuclease [Clostridium neonatale]CAI3244125.1 HNH nuclease [Clostridium neonatale]CAI3539604.1 HNH nuclease [Clostridium neonatale]